MATWAYDVFLGTMSAVYDSTVPVFGQQTMNLQPALPPEISIARFQSDRHPVFTKLFDSVPDLAGVRDSSFVISNTSDKPVIGIALKWDLVDSAGKRREHRSRTHSYLSPGARPLIAAHGNMLLFPGGFVPAASMQSAGFIGMIPDRNTLLEFQTATNVSVEIDSLIFLDGEVAGPNTMRLDQEIRERKAAADRVKAHVASARAHGKDPKEILLQTYNEKASHPADRTDREELRFMKQLLTTGHFDAVMSFIESIPDPPEFHRKDGPAL